jgi:hypothetical protein
MSPARLQRRHIQPQFPELPSSQPRPRAPLSVLGGNGWACVLAPADAAVAALRSSRAGAVVVRRTSVRTVLGALTETFLAEMRVSGFWLRAEIRYDARPWDINNGRCDEWAWAAHRLLGGDVISDDELSHYALSLGGKVYDAQCLDGCSSMSELPIARKVPR